MRYSDDIIEEVRMKNDIVDVVSQYVKLTEKRKHLFRTVSVSIMRRRRPFR